MSDLTARAAVLLTVEIWVNAAENATENLPSLLRMNLHRAETDHCHPTTHKALSGGD